jgi:ribosomal protein S18 acetylase RimI-like enzyme
MNTTVIQSTTFRAAALEDCRKIAELIRISSEGVSDYVWSTLTPEYPGLSPIEIGTKRYANEQSLFSYRNCVVAEQNHEVIGILLTFPTETADKTANDLAAAPQAPPVIPEPPEEPDVLAPYSLEAPNTWYICALALFPEFRGQGIGTQFLSIAHQQAAAHHFSELSLLCFEQNTRARKLYERNGFKVVDRTAIVPHPLIHHTGDLLLMTAPVRI